MDFKEQLPGSGESDRREFTADVSSFANAAGGDLIYGVAERRDNDGRPTGTGRVVGLPGVNFDEVRLRMENMIRTGIEPRLTVQFKEITRDQGPPCLVVRIPRSWSGLCMVTAGGLNRFYGRNSGGRYLLDVREIERGFLTGVTSRERARAFRKERIARVVAGETPVVVRVEEPKLIFHAVPLDSDEQVWTQFGTSGVGDTVANAMKAALIKPLYGYSSFGSGYTFNLDGFLAYTRVTGEQHAAYTQLFRDGALEVVIVDMLDRRQSYKGPVFSGSAIEDYVIAVVRELQNVWRQLGIVGPMMIGLVLTGLHGTGIALDRDVRNLPGSLLDLDPLVLPEIVVDDLDAAPEAMLHPIFDVLWNASGVPRSPNYQGDQWSRH